MYKVEKNVGALVAADTQVTLKALDDAILQELRMCTTVLEAIQASHLPISTSQKLLQSMTSGLGHIITGRGEMATTIKHLTNIKDNSELAPMNFGCTQGFPRTAVTCTENADNVTSINVLETAPS